MEGTGVGRGISIRRYRWVFWGVLAIACLLLAVLARHREREALDDQVRQAQINAEDHANTALSTVTTNDVSRPMVGPTYREVIVPVQAEAMTDPRVARVRIWSPDGTLLFSTDERETIGRVRLADDLAISTALQGHTTSRLIITPYRAATVGPPAVDTELFLTFSSLHVSDRVSIQGVVETDQFWEPMRSASSSPWRLFQGVLIALSVPFGLLALVSFRRRHLARTEVAPAPIATRAPAPLAASMKPGVLPQPAPVSAADAEDEAPSERDASLAALEVRVDAAEQRALEAEQRLQVLADDVSTPARVAAGDGSAPGTGSSVGAAEADPGEPEPSDDDPPLTQAAELRERLARTAARKKPGGARDEN